MFLFVCTLSFKNQKQNKKKRKKEKKNIDSYMVFKEYRKLHAVLCVSVRTVKPQVFIVGAT